MEKYGKCTDNRTADFFKISFLNDFDGFRIFVQHWDQIIGGAQKIVKIRQKKKQVRGFERDFDRRFESASGHRHRWDTESVQPNGIKWAMARYWDRNGKRQRSVEKKTGGIIVISCVENIKGGNVLAH